MSPAEITEKLQLHKLKDHLWFVHPSCATTAEGLFEGLVSLPRRCWSNLIKAWLSQNAKQPSRK